MNTFIIVQKSLLFHFPPDKYWNRSHWNNFWLAEDAKGRWKDIMKVKGNSVEVIVCPLVKRHPGIYLTIIHIYSPSHIITSCFPPLPFFL